MGEDMRETTVNDIKKFEWELKGCIKGSKIPHEKLKEIWDICHTND